MIDVQKLGRLQRKIDFFRTKCLLYQRKTVSLPLKSGDDAHAWQMKHVSLHSLNRIIANEF
jgi:hypothetical protein